jgi:hypothetical protein
MNYKAFKFGLIPCLLAFLVFAVFADNNQGGTPPVPLSIYWIISLCALGVIASFILPILIKFTKGVTNTDPNLTFKSRTKTLEFIKAYGAIAIVSFIIAIIVVAYSQSQGVVFAEWWAPFLAGYTFDSTLQKLKA